MSAQSEQFEAIRSQALTQMQNLLGSSTLTFTVNGQEISWIPLLESLADTIDWCDSKLVDCNPFELQSRVAT